MGDRRRANVDWNVADENGRVPSWECAGIAVLMDIRDEIQKLNTLLHCQNFVGIPRTLRTISRKLPVRRKAKKG